MSQLPIIAVDPGSSSSAYVAWDGTTLHSFGWWPNDRLLAYLADVTADNVVIEMISHYGSGMPAGKTVFDTCVWIGRFMQAAGAERVHLVLRATVKAHICGSAKAKDANVRTALLDRFGGKEVAVGRKANPGPLHGVSKDVWQALALGVTWGETHA